MDRVGGGGGKGGGGVIGGVVVGVVGVVVGVVVVLWVLWLALSKNRHHCFAGSDSKNLFVLVLVVFVLVVFVVVVFVLVVFVLVVSFDAGNGFGGPHEKSDDGGHQTVHCNGRGRGAASAKGANEVRNGRNGRSGVNTVQVLTLFSLFSTLFHSFSNCVHSFQFFSTLFQLFFQLFSTLFHSFSTLFPLFVTLCHSLSLFVIRFNTPVSLAVVLFSRYGVDVPDDGPITTIFDVRGSGSTLRNPSSFLITTSSLRPLIQNLRSVALESARLNQTNVADPMRYGDTLHLHESSVLEQCT